MTESVDVHPDGLDVPGRAGTRTMPPKMSDDSLKKLARLIAALKAQGYTEEEVVEYVRQHFRDNPPKLPTTEAMRLPPESVVKNWKPGDPIPE